MSKRDHIHTTVHATALGGVTAALAVVIMCLGGLIPLATFVCPVLCILLLEFIFRQCGKRIGWAWYGAVAILSMLMGPDKEAAALFFFVGYYPLIKPTLERFPLSWLWKLLIFNVAILLMYYVLINLFGMAALASEFQEMGLILLIITLALGNLTFVLLDRVLEKLVSEEKTQMTWYVYILRCGDDTLYCGSTNDLEKRFQLHCSGKGAKYTRGRGPLELVYWEQLPNQSDALKRECAIKRLTRPEKLKLIEMKTAAD